MMSDRRFDFRWGIPELDDHGGVHLYGFMLRNYARAGITRDEFLCLTHLAAYHFNSLQGKSTPALSTIAALMGYKHKNSIWRIVKSLIAKKMIAVTKITGNTNVYNAHSFARAMLDLDSKLSDTLEGDGVSHSNVTGYHTGVYPKKKNRRIKRIKRESGETPAPAIDLSFETVTHGDIVKRELEKYYAAKGRRAPSKFQSPQQRDAYEKVIASLNGRFETVVTKAIAKRGGALPVILSFCERWIENEQSSTKTNRGATPPAKTITDVDAEFERVNGGRKL